MAAVLFVALTSPTWAAAAPIETVPPTPVVLPADSPGGTVANVISTVIDNLGDNGYHTGIAMMVATVAVVAMINVKVHRALLAPVALGAFWAGWLGWNTCTGSNQPLFPGEVRATKLWDVAFTSDTGFLLVAAVACVAAVFLWRKGIAMTSRVVLIAGAVLGASFLYNLYEAIRTAPA